MNNKNFKISILKFLSIFSVVCAHCNAVLSDNVFALKCSLALQNLGSIGVLCFFVVSGYLFHFEKYSKKQLFDKIFKIFVPWIISGTVCYLYVHLRRADLSFIEYIYFIIGNGSYLYYVTMLVFFYALFFFFKFFSNKYALLFFEAVTLVSTLFFFKVFGLSPYLNPLNWIGYFALGIQIRHNEESFEYFGRKLFSLKYLVFAVWAVAFALNMIFDLEPSYWGFPVIIESWFGAISFYLIASVIAKAREGKLKKSLVIIGDNTLFVYLWHTPICGIVARIMNYGFLEYFVLVRPIIVLAVVSAALYALRLFSSNFGWILGVSAKKVENA